MPFQKWHSAVIRNWHTAVPDTLRIKKIKGHPGLRMLVGKTTADGPMKVFSWRFRKDRFSPADAEAWVAKHGFDLQKLVEAEGPDQEAQKQHTGVMVALTLPIETSRQLLTQAAALGALPEDASEPADLHITLAFLGERRAQSTPRELILAQLAKIGREWAPVTGTMNGEGRFLTDEGDGKVPLILLFDSPLLPALRSAIVEAVSYVGGFVDAGHGFTPHVTLGYMPASAPLPGSILPASLSVTIDALTLAWGDTVTHVPLTADPATARVKALAWACEQLDDETADVVAAAFKSYPAPHEGLPGHQGGSAPRNAEAPAAEGSSRRTRYMAMGADMANKPAAARDLGEYLDASTLKLEHYRDILLDQALASSKPDKILGDYAKVLHVLAKRAAQSPEQRLRQIAKRRAEVATEFAKTTNPGRKRNLKRVLENLDEDRSAIEEQGKKAYAGPRKGRVGKRGGSMPRSEGVPDPKAPKQPRQRAASALQATEGGYFFVDADGKIHAVAGDQAVAERERAAYLQADTVQAPTEAVPGETQVKAPAKSETPKLPEQPRVAVKPQEAPQAQPATQTASTADAVAAVQRAAGSAASTPVAEASGLAEWEKKTVPERLSGWSALSAQEQDTLADASKSITANVKERLAFAGERPQARTYREATAKRLAQIGDLIPPDSADKIHEHVNTLGQLLDDAGVDHEAGMALVFDAVDVLAAQENESLGRQLGDHGANHVLGDMDLGLEILSVHPDADTPKDRAAVAVAAIFHDTGYLAPPARLMLDRGHERWSGQDFDANYKANVAAALGGDTANRVSNMIATHADTNLDWDDPATTSLRLADNLALFHSEKLPGLFRYVPANIPVLYSLGKGGIDLAEAQKRMRENTSNPKLSLSTPVREALLRAVDEVNPKTAKSTLGMLAGKVDSVKWQRDHVSVALRADAKARLLQKYLDLGQSQFKKFAKAYGVNPETFASDRHATFKEGDEVVLEASITGAAFKALMEALINCPKPERVGLSLKRLRGYWRVPRC